MIAEFEVGTQLLEPTLRKAAVDEVVIEQLDAADDVPLRTVCWVEREQREGFERALEDDGTVSDATHVATTGHGVQYQVEHPAKMPGTEVYDAAVQQQGIFISGTTAEGEWELQMRFPDRDALAAFREHCETVDVEVSVAAVHDEEGPHAGQYGVSDPQREILTLAVEMGYFSVPRDASLADLATELDVSSQAASERLRRGLDSLVEQALLTPE